MDVRNIATVEPIVEHNGTTPVWYMMAPGTMREATLGGSLELVNEFEIIGGGKVDPHSHPTHEYYYVLYGRGLMIVGDEEREIGQGDLVYIPPNVVHSLIATSQFAPIRCFCFAIACPDAGEINYTTH
ncbi:MAG: Cupin 2 conserved barrel domain protein [Acidimicrobiaceae bacterium]|nr:Cupin 2 conserved barrel domain protein [Acidimicrobiaceae bacterium]